MPEPAETAPATSAPSAAASADGGGNEASSAPETVTLAAENFVRAEWSKAENRNTCTPLTFASGPITKGTPRRANFSGGWAVAWDRPGVRSAFGIAGTGFVPEDEADTAAQRARLAAQWPYFRELEQLPARAFTGYGRQGASDYPADNPDGTGLDSLAYVRVGGQTCDYNVWSKLGRAHLEALLDGLRVVPR